MKAEKFHNIQNNHAGKDIIDDPIIENENKDVIWFFSY